MNSQKEHEKTFQSANTRFTLKRCARCRIGVEHCICEVIPEVELDFAFWIVLHKQELEKPTNTANLIQQMLPSTRIFFWERKSPDVELLKLLEDPKYAPCILFPGEEAVPWEKAQYKKGKKVAFILLDGTWKQARKIYNHSPYLQKLPVVMLQDAGLSEYCLRKQSDPRHLSTVEVAMEVVQKQGHLYDAHRMKTFFRVFQWYYLRSKMHKVPKEDTQKVYQSFLELKNG
jgi:DTW domain-containing protein YfiP